MTALDPVEIAFPGDRLPILQAVVPRAFAAFRFSDVDVLIRFQRDPETSPEEILAMVQEIVGAEGVQIVEDAEDLGDVTDEDACGACFRSLAEIRKVGHRPTCRWYRWSER